MKVEKVYIDRVLYSIGKIELFTKDTNAESFLSNEMVQSAVILHLILIGENAKKVSNTTQSRIDLPWKEIIGLRNIAVHEYTALDLQDIWNTIENDILQLKEKLESYIK